MRQLWFASKVYHQGGSAVLNLGTIRRIHWAWRADQP